MRKVGQLLICVLLAVPSAQAAFGPMDLDIDGAVRAVERHVAVQSGRLALYLEVPVAQLRVVAGLPIMRELARTLGVDGLLQHRASAAPVRPRSPRA